MGELKLYPFPPAYLSFRKQVATGQQNYDIGLFGASYTLKCVSDGQTLRRSSDGAIKVGKADIEGDKTMVITKQTLSSLPCIHEGTHCVIYRQERTRYGKPVVIKLLKQVYSAPRDIDRFVNEYRLTKDLFIPGIRSACDSVTIDGRPALILEYVEGVTLREKFVEERGSLAEALAVSISISRALDDIHYHKIIHKNLSSTNILVDLRRQAATIIDFAAASKLTHANEHRQSACMLEGSPSYISPEQTGRINRSVDHRTDMYSMGVVLYEILTGRLPFVTADASELIHCHIARNPKPACDVNPEIPRVVSDIVMKLMAKSPEDRYRSAYGLKADLEQCLHQLMDTGTIRYFELGHEDVSDHFEIPEKLYGREREIEQLLAAFDRAGRGGRELFLVRGYAGVGKTSLVHQICKPVAEKHGYFIEGKFDQFQRNVPYFGWIQAFTALVRHLLMESEPRLAEWKQDILKEVGNNGRVLTDVIPKLELVIGAQPAVPELSPTGAQYRFNSVFQEFIKAVANSEHPLVLLAQMSVGPLPTNGFEDLMCHT